MQKTIPLMINAFDPARADDLDPDIRALVERRARILGPSYRLFYEKPVQFVRAEGVRLYDAKGQAYLDVYNNVPSVGHCHPRVVEAQARQAATLNTHTRYLSDVILDYAERLLATFPDPLSRVMFTCTGSESNDLAMRIAHNFTGRQGIIVTENAYHGVTTAVAAFSPSLGNGVPIGPNVRTVTVPDPATHGTTGAAAMFESGVRAAIHDLDRHGYGVAALVLDTIFSSDGVLTDPPGFIAGAVAAVRAAGGLFVADEVQPGFARTGEGMWGFQRHGIVPDLVTMGKPMGNGLPIAGVVGSHQVMSGFAERARYFNTFGGNPVCCAAALAVLDVIRDEALQANAQRVGAHILAGLRQLGADDPRVGNVRGVGLFAGVDIVDPTTGEADEALAVALVNRLRELRVLISSSGLYGHVLKIRPPLCFSISDADEFLEKIGIALRGLAGRVAHS